MSRNQPARLAPIPRRQDAREPHEREAHDRESHERESHEHDKPLPATALAVFEAQFERTALSDLLGTSEESALSLARRASRDPLERVLCRPGKGLRAHLVSHAHAIAKDAMHGLALPLPPQLPPLLELLHTGSLIVDDVEDDARLRRGAPALHRLIGVPLAINAGNLLYFLPLLALDELDLDDGAALAMHRRIVRCLTRCHHGQALDLSLRVSELPRAEIAPAVELSTALKTGALMELACALGAIAAGAPKPVEQALSRFGNEVGVVLQMFDDLSGFLNPKRRDKALEDLLERRPTWAWALAAGVASDATFSMWQQLAREVAQGGRECADALIDQMAPLLAQLRDRPRLRLDAALANLRASIGDAAAIAPLAQELAALEHGYV